MTIDLAVLYMIRLGLFAEGQRERRQAIRNCRIKVRFHIDIKYRQRNAFTHSNAVQRMKLLILAVVLVLVVTGGSALDCLHCVPEKAGGACKITTVTCPPDKDACAAAKFRRSPYGHYQKCMSMSGCEMVKQNAYINIKCCQKDFCNTFD
ncbi:CD59 glycoprotein [Labeo rohita]|nr:CD59 glycoprotein [Labeo rohita]